MIDIRKILNIKIESPYWEDAYKKALNEPMVPQWLTEKYIRKLNNECRVFPKHIEDIVMAVSYVNTNEKLCILAKTLYYILASKKKFSEAFTVFELPKPKEEIDITMGYDCFAVFPILAHLRKSWEELEKRGVEKEIISASLRWVDSLFSDSIKRQGKPSFDEISFRQYDVAIYINHLIIGRLRYEIQENSDCPVRIFKNKNGKLCVLMDGEKIHRSGHVLGSFNCTEEDGSYSADFIETHESYEGYAVDEECRLVQNFRTLLPKSEWEPVYVKGDHVIKVHIPYGGQLDKELCEHSYYNAVEIFKSCFSEIKFKGFSLCCWMLSPVLKNILPFQSNIIAFQEKYCIYPVKNSAKDAFFYVFGIEDTSPDEINYDELAEENSLMRGIKKESLAGNYIYQFSGFIPLNM